MPGRRLQGSRPSFFIAESMRPTGMAEIRRSFAPVVVSAASSALVIAASVAAAPSIREQGQLLAPLPATFSKNGLGFLGIRTNRRADQEARCGADEKANAARAQPPLACR